MRRRPTDEEKALAAKLRSEGLSFREIGRRLGVSHRTIMYWACDKVKARHKANEYRYRADPEKLHRHKVMRVTREIARQRGVPVSQVRQEWGVE